MVVSELRGEKIDIIPYNDEPARFVAKALSPARVREVLVDDENKQATVIVPDDQLSLAIGREGQNARLAARLTGWRVDIRSETEFAKEETDARLRGGGGRRPLRRDPRQRPPLPERRAAGLALLRPRRATRRSRTRTPTSIGRVTPPRPASARAVRDASRAARAPRSGSAPLRYGGGRGRPRSRRHAPRAGAPGCTRPPRAGRPPSPAAAFQRAFRAPVTIPERTVDFISTWQRSASTS